MIVGVGALEISVDRLHRSGLNAAVGCGKKWRQCQCDSGDPDPKLAIFPGYRFQSGDDAVVALSWRTLQAVCCVTNGS
jgi:hypothetical protein